LPEDIKNCWIVDRGILCRGLLRGLGELKQFVIGRMRRNQVVYFAPEQSKTGGRQRIYGEKSRVDHLRTQFSNGLRRKEMTLRPILLGMSCECSRELERREDINAMMALRRP
jgi:hypothetical protein